MIGSMALARSVRPAPLRTQGKRSALHAVGQFILVGIGMGVILTGWTIATAWLGDGLIKRARALGRHIAWLGAVVLWLAGAYVLYYWLTAIGLL